MAMQTVRIYVMKHGVTDELGEITPLGLEQAEATIQACFQSDRVPIRAMYTSELLAARQCAELAARMVDYDVKRVTESRLAADDIGRGNFEEFLRALVKYVTRTLNLSDPQINVVVVTSSPNVEFGLIGKPTVNHGDAVLYEFRTDNGRDVERLPTAQHLPCPMAS